ncbi:alternative ribosome rescue aminoacyl-tRNA hydrolase ArfB [Kangiella sp. TOML190]|uniref:alternative ribosome rescue aminoacyl-tRNA hydrolase ArfB n=1 Tax=Kangiella sp. TOML190 TaxID=2931351 RepID=UPI00203CF2D4|nr:alternative ribosome rescue aminoacyl-tRNA hydrolase ArfB [Kangiella sp. TOML190]
MNLVINNNLYINSEELEFTAIRAQGAGGQNVNKVSSAIHLRWDIKNSSIPEHYKEKLLAVKDSRLTANGEFILKAQTHRTQARNRDDAINRLKAFVESAIKTQKKRIKTRPTLGSKKRRLESKKRNQQKKSLRAKLKY